MKLTRHIVTFCFAFLAFSCFKKSDDTFRSFKKWKLDFEADSVPMRDDKDPYEGKYYVHLDKGNVYGPGISYVIPDSLYYSYIKVKVAFAARMDGRRFGQSLAVAIQNGDKTYYWYTFDIAPKSLFKNKWIEIKDSLQFVMSEEMIGAKINIFPFNPYHKSKLDIDCLEAEIIKVN